MQVNLSERGKTMPASQIRKLVPFADEAKRKGIHVYHLNIGQPDIETPAPVLDVLRNFDKNVIAYTPSRGDSVYLDALLDYYAKMGIKLEKDQLNVTTGGSEAVFFSFLLTMNPDDEVIIPEPFYTNYNGFACMAGVKIVPVTTHGENGFHLPSKEKIASLITPKTKAILLCNPSNPTGTVYTREEVDMIASLVKEHNLWLFCDEVYREFVFNPKNDAYQSALQIKGLKDQLIVIDSISKRFSMCGARLGCMVSRNKELMNAALSLAQARLSSPQVAQAMAVAAHYLPDDYLPSMIDEYRRRRDVVYHALLDMKDVQVAEPEGAFYLIPKLPIKNAEHFAKWLLTDFSHNNETVMISPAAGFYATKGLGLDEIRIAYVLNETELKRAMELLKLALEQYND